MPDPLRPPSLVLSARDCCGALLHSALLRLETAWTLDHDHDRSRNRRASPRVSPVAPCSVILPPSPEDPREIDIERRRSWSRRGHSRLRRWLTGMPRHLTQAVVDRCLDLIHQAQYAQDLDLRLVQSLIGTPNSNPPTPDDAFPQVGGLGQFLFGVHSLLEVVAAPMTRSFDELLLGGSQEQDGQQQECAVTRLNITRKTWVNVLEYGSSLLGPSSPVETKLMSVMPRLTSLTHINLAKIATDKLCYLLSRHLHLLDWLNLDGSDRLTDRGLAFLAGMRSSGIVLFPEACGSASASHSCSPSCSSSPFGCPDLKFLSIEKCSGVTDAGVWAMLTRMQKLETLKYHQIFSVAEILLKECSRLSPAQLASAESAPRVSLTSLTHPFPYGLSVADDGSIEKVAKVANRVRELNVVVSDHQASLFSSLDKLTSLSVELEDCFGMGLHSLLASRDIGKHLTQLSISCSSDADSAILPEEAEGGQPFQLFNAGIKLAISLCDCVNTLKKLTIAGCGLVSNTLLSKLRDVPSTMSSSSSSLEELILLSYEEDHPMQTCDGELLLNLVKGVSCSLRVLSLEGNFAQFLDDAFFAAVADRNPDALAKLQVLDIQGTRLTGLTSSTAEAMLALPKIKEIRLSSWNLSNEEAERLKTAVKNSGFDVNFRR